MSHHCNFGHPRSRKHMQSDSQLVQRVNELEELLKRTQQLALEAVKRVACVCVCADDDQNACRFP